MLALKNFSFLSSGQKVLVLGPLNFFSIYHILEELLGPFTELDNFLIRKVIRF